MSSTDFCGLKWLPGCRLGGVCGSCLLGEALTFGLGRLDTLMMATAVVVAQGWGRVRLVPGEHGIGTKY